MTARRTPVVILTGFLGSGKTTLLSRLLRDPAAEGSLVLVNEIGEVGLDHELLWSGGEVPLLLENGCVCCSVGDDLASVLEDLFWARLQRRIPPFQRVVIETTGIADPSGVIAALASRPLVAERYRPAAVVATVAVPDGTAALDRRPEAAAQVALADLLVLTKSDLADPGAAEGLRTALLERNPMAEVVAAEAVEAVTLLADRGGEARGAPGHPPHAHDLTTFTLALRDLADPGGIDAALGALAALTPRLLRAKGVVRVGGVPWLIEVAGGRAVPPRPWPGRKATEGAGRLVLIGEDLSRDEARAALGPLLA